MADIYNPVTKKNYRKELDDLGSCRDDSDLEEGVEGFLKKNTAMARTLFICGLLTTFCTIAIGSHELMGGNKIEFIDTSALRSDDTYRADVEDSMTIIGMTFCRGVRRPRFCDW